MAPKGYFQTETYKNRPRRLPCRPQFPETNRLEAGGEAMKWINCPTCHGALFGYMSAGGHFMPLGDGEEDERKAPCPTCTDSDGNPTGRVCVMGEATLIALAMGLETSGHWQMTIQPAAEAELSHRKG